MKVTYPDLKNKTVLVTGSASGMGHAQCLSFLEQGCLVYGIDINDTKINDTNFHSLKRDLSQSKKIAPVINNLPDFDIICNTAGILDDFKKSTDISLDYWLKIINTNLTSIFTISNTIIKKSLNSKHHLTFVNMASIASFMASGGGAAYTASKHAITGYTKQLNFDYGKLGVRANCIAPGAVKTNMTKADFKNNATIAKKVASQTVIGRYAKPSEIADLTMFLASKASKYIYGATIPIDGGFSLGKEI